ncbi:MAG: cytidylate kinase family protein, partial [Candidatus Moranbacteria bacterium]|nr:cytidylate kinase family protein [Candidatus Moranbacteria bacterium]
MIISMNGDLGAGKSTIAKKIAEELGMKRYYMGQILRDMSKERGMTFLEFMKVAETDSSIDKDIDEYVKKLGREENNFIIESRTAWSFIPDSVKIYLSVDEEEGVRRIHKELQADNKRNEDVKSFEELLKNCQRRILSEQKRYKKYYNFNIRDLSHYDFVLNTTNLNPQEVLGKNLEFLRSFRQIERG